MDIFCLLRSWVASGGMEAPRKAAERGEGGWETRLPPRDTYGTHFIL